MRAEGEVGVQFDIQDFRVSVLWGYLVSYSQLLVKPGLAGIRDERGHAIFLGGKDQLLTIWPPHRDSTK